VETETGDTYECAFRGPGPEADAVFGDDDRVFRMEVGDGLGVGEGARQGAWADPTAAVGGLDKPALRSTTEDADGLAEAQFGTLGEVEGEVSGALEDAAIVCVAAKGGRLDGDAHLVDGDGREEVMTEISRQGAGREAIAEDTSALGDGLVEAVEVGQESGPREAPCAPEEIDARDDVVASS